MLGAARARSVEQVERLGYAAAAVNEALRLTPVVPLLYLEANEDTTLGDVAVPRGAPVILLTRPSRAAGAVRGRRDVPSRALARRRGRRTRCRGQRPRSRCAHLFGAGPRACPGRSRLALLEARVALATLFRSFDVERSSAPVSERYTSTLAPSGLWYASAVATDARPRLRASIPWYHAPATSMAPRPTPRRAPALSHARSGALAMRLIRFHIEARKYPAGLQRHALIVAPPHLELGLPGRHVR